MKTKKMIFTALKIIVFILPFAIGAVGFYNAGEPVMDALYSSLTLYPINMSSDKRNVLIEIARWAAPLATAGGLLLIFRNALARLVDAIKVVTGGVTAVYGNNPYAETLRRNIKKSIRGSFERISGAEDHVLLFDTDADNLAFFDAHEKDFKGVRAFIQIDGVSPGNLRGENLRMFSIPEITARLYWREHTLLPFYAGGKLSAKIAIIGFDLLGQKILDYALLNNIYAPDQRIEYHVWGGSARYEATHTQLGGMAPDMAVFHGCEWEKDAELLREMDRVIVTGRRGDALPMLDALVTLCPQGEIHAEDGSGRLLVRIFRHDHLRSFGGLEDILTEGNIKTDALYRAAKLLNYRYFLLYGGKAAPSDPERVMEEQWNALDGFTKYANIAAADYHRLRLKIMEKAKQDEITFSQRELDELEHIRWCRYHYLNNWQYGVPENGKAKDARLRIHACLVPFAELSEFEKDKDTEMIGMLMEISRDTDIFRI